MGLRGAICHECRLDWINTSHPLFEFDIVESSLVVFETVQFSIPYGRNQFSDSNSILLSTLNVRENTLETHKTRLARNVQKTLSHIFSIFFQKMIIAHRSEFYFTFCDFIILL